MYRSAAGQAILINPKSGFGDVVAEVDRRGYVAECKGGVSNTKHAGQLSRLRKGLAEAEGLSLDTERVEGRRQFAVAPKTATTIALAKKNGGAGERRWRRNRALVDGFGNVEEISTQGQFQSLRQ